MRDLWVVVLCLGVLAACGEDRARYSPVPDGGQNNTQSDGGADVLESDVPTADVPTADAVPDSPDDADPLADDDDDGAPNIEDNCPTTANNSQADGDQDGHGDACDNCPSVPNGDQIDTDGDGQGDACQVYDGDLDGVEDADDNCPDAANPSQNDTDDDGIGNACDNCPTVPNFGQADSDGDGIGDACVNADSDGDGLEDTNDNCPWVSNSGQTDEDDDGVGDACDNCPSTPNFSQLDSDGDGTGDACQGDCSDTCPAASACDRGVCTSLCEIARRNPSHVGCEFWTADLDNVEDSAQPPQPYAVTVSNPNATAATVTMTRSDGVVLSLANATVAAGSSRTYTMPTDRGLDGTGVFSAHAWRIETDVPVSAQQINAMRADQVYTIDSSLLLPTDVLGTDYTAVSWPQVVIDDIFSQVYLHGFVTVVATSEGTTSVTVRPTVLVAAGTGVTEIGAGVTRIIQLTRGQVLNLETGGQTGDDLTGSSIHADKPVAVFSGHECANVPTAATNYCDHLEEQLLPAESWGTDFAVVPFAPRNSSEIDRVRVVAGAQDATVFAVPPQPFGVLTVAAGTMVDIDTRAPFLLASDVPIQVGHYLAGSNYAGFGVDALCSQNGDTGIGDPAFKLLVSLEQFRQDYTVSVPEGFRRNVLEIVRLDGEVRLDGAVVGAFTSLGAVTLSYSYQTVSAGTHHLTGTQPFGVALYGYDCDVSYALPGGMNLGTN